MTAGRGKAPPNRWTLPFPGLPGSSFFHSPKSQPGGHTSPLHDHVPGSRYTTDQDGNYDHIASSISTFPGSVQKLRQNSIFASTF
jgi:hypothetical protein